MLQLLKNQVFTGFGFTAHQICWSVIFLEAALVYRSYH
jgi:hypothetical protein